jgi:uncharacterized NAD(P)/FAD-binding protein YdhS
MGSLLRRWHVDHVASTVATIEAEPNPFYTRARAAHDEIQSITNIPVVIECVGNTRSKSVHCERAIWKYK